MQVSYPLTVGPDGRIALAENDAHIEQMIEQVLFTDMGERVNRPDFGCGLSNLVFEPFNSELAAVTQALVRGSLLKWLGDLIQIEALTIKVEDATLTITIGYAVLQDRSRGTAVFVRG